MKHSVSCVTELATSTLLILVVRVQIPIVFWVAINLITVQDKGTSQPVKDLSWTMTLTDFILGLYLGVCTQTTEHK